MRYEFVVQGTVTSGVLDQFSDFSATTVPTGTALFGRVRDDAEARTVVTRLFSLDLPVIEVRPLPD